ncbi:uncharacterized protein [Battus philenor]|uniref:uncharacterized protein n=1 Tax=Battus philenor TaxID=42288 RepID=UPI0035D132A5
MRMLSGWRVAKDVVTLSDHRHIVFDVAIRRPVADSGGRDGSTTRRWCLKRLDKDRLEAAACVADWPNAEEVLSEPERGANWFRETLTQICGVVGGNCGTPQGLLAEPPPVHPSPKEAKASSGGGDGQTVQGVPGGYKGDAEGGS